MSGYEMNEHKEWLNFYGRPLTLKRYLWRIVNHLEFLYTIIRQKPKSAIEIGIGTAAHSLFVSHFVPSVIGVDDNLQIVKFAKESSKKLGNSVKFIVASAFNLPFKANSFDLCFSQGFFEHFHNKEVNDIAREQTRIARLIIFSVPSHKYGATPFGDERLLKRSEWSKLLNRRAFVIRSKYSYIDSRLVGFFMNKNYTLYPLETLIFITQR